MSKIAPCLWFDGQAEEAAGFYVSLLPDSRIGRVSRRPDGAALTVEFTVAGQPFMALNGGPQYSFTEAVSFTISCEDQAEVDRLWDALTADGGSPSRCGWLKDRFGLSWQIIPKALGALIGHSDREGAGRAMQAMLAMTRIDVDELKRAFAGG